VGHQSGNEIHVAAKPVQLGNNDRTLDLAGSLDRGGELTPALEGISALAGFTE
jgi:hypothetical protein